MTHLKDQYYSGRYVNFNPFIFSTTFAKFLLSYKLEQILTKHSMVYRSNIFTILYIIYIFKV